MITFFNEYTTIVIFLWTFFTALSVGLFWWFSNKDKFYSFGLVMSYQGAFFFVQAILYLIGELIRNS
jgi:hypothetical protein